MDWTLRTWLTQAATQIDADDARHLAMDGLRMSPTELFLCMNDPLGADQVARLDEWLSRRVNGEPVAYITGSRGFWSLDLQVDSSTLIPRADTETLVEAALTALQNLSSPQVLDLGTGSGAIALAIAKERADVSVIATDCSAQALQVATGNAQRLSLRNVVFMQGDWFKAFPSAQAFDLIVSNPPYIRADDEHLARGDLRFEPRSALVSGPDGLDDIRRIVASAREHLKPGGQLMLEHGYDQAAAVQQLMLQEGFGNVRTVQDFGGNDRVTAGCA